MQITYRDTGGCPSFSVSMSEEESKFRWRDSRTLTYTKIERGVENIWGFSIESSLHKQLTSFDESRIYSYDWAHDGATLAVERGGVIRNALQVTDGAWH